ncbi:hypothetical protein KIPB_012183, partial [Kipferlia bialata]
IVSAVVKYAQRVGKGETDSGEGASSLLRESALAATVCLIALQCVDRATVGMELMTPFVCDIPDTASERVLKAMTLCVGARCLPVPADLVAPCLSMCLSLSSVETEGTPLDILPVVVACAPHIIAEGMRNDEDMDEEESLVGPFLECLRRALAGASPAWERLVSLCLESVLPPSDSIAEVEYSVSNIVARCFRIADTMAPVSFAASLSAALAGLAPAEVY